MVAEGKTKPEADDKKTTKTLNKDLDDRKDEKEKGQQKNEKSPDQLKKEAQNKVQEKKKNLEKAQYNLREEKKIARDNAESHSFDLDPEFPPSPHSEDAGAENYYFGDQKKAEKLTSEALGEKHNADIKLIEDYKTLEGLDPNTKKAAQTAMQREFVKNNIDFQNLEPNIRESAAEEARTKNPNFDKLSPEEKKKALLNTKTVKEKVKEFVEEYEKKRASKAEKLSSKELEELAKTNLGLVAFDEKADMEKFSIPNNDEMLKSPELLNAGLRGATEENLREIVSTLGDNLKWEHIPDSIKTRIQFDPSFDFNEKSLPKFFREEFEEQRAIWREDKGTNETQEQYLKRIKKATGIDEQGMKNIISRSGDSGKLHPFVKFLADIFAPVGAAMGGEVGAKCRQYMATHGSTGSTMHERFVKGARGGGGEVSGSMAGYSLDVSGEITESEKQSIIIVHEALKKKVSDPVMQEKLLKILERHAKNNSNFTSSQPFFAHDVATKQGFVYFPGGDVEVCPATHGYAGVGNIKEGGGTSLGSKLLAPGFEGGHLKHRTIVKGLESCNANDEERLVRVHEWRGPGTNTAGCSGLPDGIAARLKESVKMSGGGVQEVFNSKTIQTEADKKLAASANGELPLDFVKNFELSQEERRESYAAYWDYGQWSIGYGTRARSENEHISDVEAQERLKNELSSHAQRIDGFAKQYNIRLNQNERNALISFDYNLGEGGRILGVYSQSGKSAAAAKMREFVKADGRVLPGLVTRRDAESNLFLN